MSGAYAGHQIAVAATGNLVGVLTRVVGAETYEDQVFAQRPADNALGSSSVTAGATLTLVSVTVAAAPAIYRLWGFRVWCVGTGEPTDCKAWLDVGGIEIHADEVSILRRVATVRLPIPEVIVAGSVVALKVFNRGATATFAGKILAE
mgnify:CR=1 FL=1